MYKYFPGNPPTAVHIADLDKAFFSGKNGNKLMFHKQYLGLIPMISNDNLSLMNNNFNKLAEKLNKKGIELVFMPVVEKYNIIIHILKILTNMWLHQICLSIFNLLPAKSTNI